MVKDVHGDNIVFVQNFAQMFGNRYVAGNTYQFVVNKEANNADNDFRYYDVRDKNGLPFRLKCDKDTYLIPNQKDKLFALMAKPEQTYTFSRRRRQAIGNPVCYPRNIA